MKQKAERTSNSQRATGNDELRIELRYYAMFREARGCSSEVVETAARTPRELFRELGLDEAVGLDEQRLRVAVNDEFAAWDTSLERGDVVVFLAPFSGG